MHCKSEEMVRYLSIVKEIINRIIKISQGEGGKTGNELLHYNARNRYFQKFLTKYINKTIK